MPVRDPACTRARRAGARPRWRPLPGVAVLQAWSFSLPSPALPLSFGKGMPRFGSCQFALFVRGTSLHRVDAEVPVVGAGVVGCATALALARRGAAVAVLEAEPQPGLAASATNSGILHTGFDSPPGELETALILRSAQLR